MSVNGLLLPGLDYLGSWGAEALVLDLPSGSAAVRVGLAASNPEILNLQRVRLLDSNRRAIEIDDRFSVSVSTVLNADDGRFGEASVRSGGPLHTCRENHPFIEFVWSGATPRAIEIQNRQDEFGRRSSTLYVSVRVASTWHTVYRHDDPGRALDALRNIAGYVSPVILHSALSSPDPAASRLVLLREVIRTLEQSPEALRHGISWLLPLLDIYGGGASEDVRGISAYFASLILRAGSVQNIQIARRILGTRDKLKDANAMVNGWLASCSVAARYSFTRHGVQRAHLLERRDEYLSLASRVMSMMREAGFESFVSYGSLLGLVRDGDLISHDDDFDVVFVGSGEPLCRGDRDNVIRLFREAGLRVSLQDPCLNFHVSQPGSDVTVDVFPSWRSGGELHMYMERMTVRAIDAGLVAPLTVMKAFGRELVVPARAKDFLRERYGESWAVSDPYFEWPYPLGG